MLAVGDNKPTSFVLVKGLPPDEQQAVLIDEGHRQALPEYWQLHQVSCSCKMLCCWL